MIDIEILHYKNAFKLVKNTTNKTVKHLIRDLKTKKYNSSIHYELLKFNAHSLPSFDFKNTRDFFSYEKELVLKYLKNDLFFSNIIEKYIVYTDENKEIDITEEDLKLYHDMLVNSKSVEERKNIMANIFFKLSHEQMILQERYFEQYVFRMVTIFEDCEVSKEKIKELTTLDFEKLISLIWFLFAHIVTQDKVISYVNREVFKRALNNRDIINVSEEDIDIFFDFISISKDEFRKKYFYFRTDSQGKLLSYEKLEHVDQYLPKPSFYFPFLKTDKNTLQLVSYTALMQFVHLESVFSLIADSDIKYRKQYLGDLLEKYIFKLFLNFQDTQGDDVIRVHYYEDQTYFPTRRITRHYPDIIVEGKDYIIFIESKSSALNLKEAIQNFNEESFSNTIKAIDKSKININEYLKYNPLSLNNIEDKKIYKFVCFNVVSSSMLSSLLNADFIEGEDLIMTDLSSLEMFTHIKDKINVIEFLDEFISGIKNPTMTSSLQHFCMDRMEIDTDKFKKKHSDVIKNYLLKSEEIS